MLRILVLVMILTTALPAMARGAAPAEGLKTFAVSPFAVNGPDKYAYLGQGVQSMLTTRLTWPGRLEPVDAASLRQGAAVDSAARAGQALEGLKADYLVWGSTTIVGETLSLDVRVADRKGQVFSGQDSMPLAEMIPSLEKLAAQINTQLFKRPAEAKAARPAPAGSQNPFLKPAQEEVGGPLNPSFRYESGAGAGEGRWRSRALPLSGDAMTLADLDGDKRPEVVFGAGNTLHAFKRDGQELRDLATFELAPRTQILHLSAMDVDGDGAEEIVVSGWRNDDPSSSLVGLQSGKLTAKAENLRQHLRAVRLPPDFRKVLLGQQKGNLGPLDAGNVKRMEFAKGELRAGSRFPLPDDTNVYNFIYLPTREGLKTVIIDKHENLAVHNSAGQRLSTSEDAFNGTGLGVAIDDVTLPGMGQERKSQREDFVQFFPMDMAVADLEGNGAFTLLANKNLTVAGQLFERFRGFTQGEIHALQWDGVGLQLLWKTERIKGTVLGYDVADLDGDGVKDLVVGIVADTGGLGSSGRTILLAYSLAPQAAQPEAR